MKNNFLKRFICGFGIGFAFIVPGISGSAIAMLLGVYEEMISAVSDIFKRFVKSILFLLPIFLGVVLAVGSMYFPITWLLKKNLVATVMLFAGFIVGGLKPMVKKAEVKSAKKRYFVYFALTFAFVIGLSCLKFIKGVEVDLLGDVSVKQYSMIFLVGIIFAISMVLPGVSGATLLMAVGYYAPLFDLGKTMVKQLFHGKFVGQSYLLVLLLALGVVIGVLLMANLMKKGFEKFPQATYMAVCGLAIGSIPAIFVAQDWQGAIPVWNVFLSVGTFVCGVALSYLLVYLQEKQDKKNSLENEKIISEDGVEE